jgi:pyruvate ferredoxin oxidoreductase alpha subunit
MVVKQEEKSVFDREELMTGTDAVAEAVKLVDVDVFAAYPIRPYTGVMDRLAKFIANGDLDAEYIVADGEHSQFEIGKHASSVGARAFVGSSGTGWLYAMESIGVTATDRLPLVALVGNRALDDPGAFGVEHNDALLVRDLGWLLCWASTAQEALDNTLIAYRVAEDPKVRMPAAVAMDGGYLTHSQHMVRVPTKEAVRDFLPSYDLGNRRMHPDNPVSIAPQANEDWVMELRRQNYEAAKRSRKVIYAAYEEYNNIFHSEYENPFIEETNVEDADTVLVGMGSASVVARSVANEMRREGKKVGFLKIRWYRPYPTDEIRKALGNVSNVGIIERNFAMGAPDEGAITMQDLQSTLYDSKNHPRVVDFIAGLGGREISKKEVRKMFEMTADKKSPKVSWIGLRE